MIITKLAKGEINSILRVLKNNPNSVTEEHLTEIQKIADMANKLLIEAAKGYAKIQIEKAMEKK